MMGFASRRGEHIPPSPHGESCGVSPEPVRPPRPDRVPCPTPGAGDVTEPRYLRGCARPAALPAFRNRARAPANHSPDPDALIESPRLPAGQPGRVFQASPGAGGFRSAPAC